MTELPQTNDMQQTGDCYESSYKTAEEFAKMKELIESAKEEDTEELHPFKKFYEQYGLHREITIVHGWVRPDPNKEARTHHAWVEVNERILESQIGRADQYTKEQYNEIYGPVTEMTKYTVAEAKAMIEKYGFYGNWAAKELAEERHINPNLDR